MKILVIEDTPANMRLVTDILEREAYTVYQAETAEKGIELAQEIMFDLILMDICLPVMDGLAATRILKGFDHMKHTPIIALTAHAMKEDQEAIFAAGCDAYMAKPIRYKPFLEMIKQHCTDNKDRP